MLIDRTASETLKILLAQYPVVTLLGPRQAGKTTLARMVAPALPYTNLEDLRSREFATNDPIGFLGQFQDGAIIDEIQRVPELTSQLQVIVDEKKKKGMFILTGSHQFDIHEKVSQSLAGRTAIFRLLPLSLKELHGANEASDTDELLFRGGYPQIYAEQLNPAFYYQDYVATYIERDLRQISEIRNLDSFRRFLKLCASFTGQILNISELGSAVGISQPQAKTWLSILQASYIVYLLQPYHANLKKRLVKRPKLYFYDTGLACFLLDILESGHVASHPLRGALFENLVVAEVLKQRSNKHLPSNCYFYRDKTGNEVDLLYREGATLNAIEVKSGKTIAKDFFDGLNHLKSLQIPEDIHSILVYNGDQSQKRQEFDVFPLLDFALNLS